MSKDAIKLDHLRYFVAAVDTGSFAAAGEQMNIAPTSIAHGISVIEDSLNVSLLIRRRASGVTPNRQGKDFVVAARNVLREVESLVDEFKPAPNTLKGELVVGCQEGLTWSVAPLVIEEMQRLHPDLRISIKTVFMEDGYDPIESGAVELLLTFTLQEVKETGIHCQTLCCPQAYAMMRAGHPLMKTVKADKISLKDLAPYPHIFIEDGPALPIICNMYGEHGLTPNLNMGSNISPSAQAVVGKSDIVSLRIVRPSIDVSPLGDKLAYIEVKEKVTKPYLVALTMTNSQSRISPKASAFLDICRTKFEDGSFRDNFFY